jgi:hypothetical protein
LRVPESDRLSGEREHSELIAEEVVRERPKRRRVVRGRQSRVADQIGEAVGQAEKVEARPGPRVGDLIVRERDSGGLAESRVGDPRGSRVIEGEGCHQSRGPIKEVPARVLVEGQHAPIRRIYQAARAERRRRRRRQVMAPRHIPACVVTPSDGRAGSDPESIEDVPVGDARTTSGGGETDGVWG